MPSKQPTKDIKVTEPVENDLEKKRKEFQAQAARKKKPASFAPKHKKNFLIGIMITVLLLLGLGSVAIYGFVYNNPDRIVTSAIIKALSSGTTNFAVTYKIGSAYTIDASGGLAGANGAKLTAKLTTVKDNKTSAFSTDAVVDKDGNLYLSGEGIKSTLGSDLVRDALNQGSYANILLQKIEGKWLKINSDELAPYNKKYAAIQSCIETVFKKIQDDQPLLRESADIYSKNKFLIVEKSLGTKDGSTGYSILLDSEKLKSFLTKFKETSIYNKFLQCDSATFELDVDKRVNQLTKSDSRPTKLELWVNGKDELTEAVMESSVAGEAGRLTIRPEFNQEVKIVAPTATVSVNEIHEYLVDGTKAMTLRDLTDPASQQQYRELLDKLRATP